MSLWICILLSLFLYSCSDIRYPVFLRESTSCPTPDEPYLHPDLCADIIPLPYITELIFDPPGGKVPIRVRFLGDARGGVEELDESVILHWDLDGDGLEDTATNPGESFYYHYDECESRNFQVWASDRLGRISRPRRKSLNFHCNLPPVINKFGVLLDFGAPGNIFQFQVDALDPDPENPDLIHGIAYILWDMDGDGEYETKTDAAPTVVDFKYVYPGVGIFRPRIRVYDEEGDYRESNRLLISVLGSSELIDIQNIVTAAQVLVATPISHVVSFDRGSITIRGKYSSKMEQIGQAAAQVAADSVGVARHGSLYFVTNNALQQELSLWLASPLSDATASEKKPLQVASCRGIYDHLNTVAKFGRRPTRILFNQFVGASGQESWVVMTEQNDPGAEGVLFVADVSAATALSVTDNTGTSCPGGLGTVFPAPAVIGLHNGASELSVNKRFYPADLTATGRYLWVAARTDGVRIVDLYNFRAAWQQIRVTPSRGKISGYSGEYQARSIAALPGDSAVTEPVLVYSKNVTSSAVTLETAFWFDTTAPVKLMADGWPVPVSVSVVSGHTLKLQRNDWENFALAVSSLTVQARSKTLIAVGDAEKTSLRLFAVDITHGVQVQMIADAGRSKTPSGGRDGKIILNRNWIVRVVSAGNGYESGVFVYPITSPADPVRVQGAADYGPNDLTWDGENVWIAAGSKGVYSVQLPSPGSPAEGITINGTLSYFPGATPRDLYVDSVSQQVWVAEGAAGLHMFRYLNSYQLQSESRLASGYNVQGLAADSTNRTVYMAAGTAVVAWNMDTLSPIAADSGRAGVNCLDYRADGTTRTLVFCDQPGERRLTVRSLSSGQAMVGADTVLVRSDGADIVLGPQNAVRPRIFYGTTLGLDVYCPNEPNGRCTGDPFRLPGTAYNEPIAAPYRYRDLDLILVGGKNGFLTFWNFTDTPGELGTVFMCDPVERWLPSSLCGVSIVIRDVSVVGPYAFLATNIGVFVVDLTAVPILRVGSFITGVSGKELPSLRKITALYRGGGQYIAYAVGGDSVLAFRFSQLEAP